MKKFVNGRSIFLVSLILTVILFYSLSKNFFLTNFLKIEQIQNTKHINNLLKHINVELNQVKKIANTFVYNGFNINSVNNIQELGLDFVVYQNINENTSYSRYNLYDEELASLLHEKNDFEQTLFKTFKHTYETQEIFIYKEHIVYLVKKKINPNATIYLGKLLINSNHNRLSSDFEQVSITHIPVKSPTTRFSTKYIQQIDVVTQLEKRQLVNNIAFYTKNEQFLFSIHTVNQRKLLNEGTRTIQIVNIIMAVFLAIILYVIYKSQVVFRRMLQKDKKSLEIKVERRTQQLEELLKKLKKSNEQLHYLAYCDPLTKTHNRRSFFIESEKVLQKAAKKEQTVSLVMIDIDDFKQINDKYGHAMGDKVLVAFTTMIKDDISEKEIFGRLGGEEFAIIFPNTTLEEASKKVEKLRKMIANLDITLKENQHIKFTASFGLNDNTNDANIDEILKGADDLLYSAKHNGKNVVRSRLTMTAPFCDLY